MAAKPPRARVDARAAGRAEAHREERRRRGPARRRASHSLESVLSEAVALLDESGEQALTFRALADRLGGGVASIYWYVASKDELLDRAAVICFDSCDGLEIARVDEACAGRIVLDELLRISDHIEEFGAVLDGPEVAGGGNDLRRDNHNDS